MNAMFFPLFFLVHTTSSAFGSDVVIVLLAFEGIPGFFFTGSFFGFASRSWNGDLKLTLL